MRKHFDNLRQKKAWIDKKMLGLAALGTAVVCSAAPLDQLDSLSSRLSDINTKTENIMAGIGILTLTVVIGIIVIKLTKKGQRGG